MYWVAELSSQAHTKECIAASKPRSKSVTLLTLDDKHNLKLNACMQLLIVMHYMSFRSCRIDHTTASSHLCCATLLHTAAAPTSHT